MNAYERELLSTTAKAAQGLVKLLVDDNPVDRADLVGLLEKLERLEAYDSQFEEPPDTWSQNEDAQEAETLAWAEKHDIPHPGRK